MRAFALPLLALALAGCAFGASCEPHECAADEPCDPTDPSRGGGYESCSGVYLGVRASTSLVGDFDQERAHAALVAIGLDAHRDEATGGVSVQRDPEALHVSPSLAGNTTQWTWLHDAERIRSRVSAVESLRLAEEDRARVEARAEEVLARFEELTGLSRGEPLAWHPQVGIH